MLQLGHTEGKYGLYYQITYKRGFSFEKKEALISWKTIINK